MKEHREKVSFIWVCVLASAATGWTGGYKSCSTLRVELQIASQFWVSSSWSLTRVPTLEGKGCALEKIWISRGVIHGHYAWYQPRHQGPRLSWTNNPKTGNEVGVDMHVWPCVFKTLQQITVSLREHQEINWRARAEKVSLTQKRSLWSCDWEIFSHTWSIRGGVKCLKVKLKVSQMISC